jgi:hypothetical protein
MIKILTVALASCAMIVVSGAAVSAHGHHGGGGNDGGLWRGGSKGFSARHTDEDYRHEGRHHHGTGPGGLGTVHGLGSSHNPVVYHPPVTPVPKPVVGAGPARPAPPYSGRPARNHWRCSSVGRHRCIPQRGFGEGGLSSFETPAHYSGALPEGGHVSDHRH